jgi:outer membrane protein assembly factor BamE
MPRFSVRFSVRLFVRMGVALLSALLLLSANGCSNLEFPWVYRLKIDQGNIITQEMVDQLKPGMSRDQVKFVMGSPLIVDPFHQDRWDYVYTLRDAKGKSTRQGLTVLFANDTLSGLSGDFMPHGAEATQTN